MAVRKKSRAMQGAVSAATVALESDQGAQECNAARECSSRVTVGRRQAASSSVNQATRLLRQKETSRFKPDNRND